MPFKNVIYQLSPVRSYERRLCERTSRGYERELQIKDNYDDAGLEKLKLGDGVRVHENSKVELEVFARDNGKPIVKPFMLIVAKDTNHADDLHKIIEDESFFGGRYKGKVITVHSNLKGEESEERTKPCNNFCRSRAGITRRKS